MPRKVLALVCLAGVLAGCGLVSSPTPPAGTLIEPLANLDTHEELAAGSYYVDTPFPVRLSFEVPDGMNVWAYTSVGTQVNLEKPTAGEVSFEIVDNVVVANPCSPEPKDPPVGPTVDDLVEALSNLVGFEASAVTDVTIDGYSGKQFTLTAPPEDEAACLDMYTWRTTTRQNGVGPGEVAEIQIVDVAGVRLLVAMSYGPLLSSTAREELEGIIDSVQLEP